ncbi:MAG: branched-chain amino acid ABC transporter permease [Actinomycetota bacterium]|nr:branched-chain amino acid ABC transporter permease [Actinomycetota bacterium]
MSSLPRLPRPSASALIAGAVIFAVAVMPLFRDPIDGFVSDTTKAMALVVMALGLNIVVGFAGLLDLGYVAFFAIGAYTMGWLGSGFFDLVNNQAGIHVGASQTASSLPGIHLNFVLVLVAAVVLTALLGALIGLPTLRLRGDYIAIVTLAFGEIIRVIAVNGDEISVGGYELTQGRQGITPIDQPAFPVVGEFDSTFDLRPYYWLALLLVLLVLLVNLRLRDSRLGRAWIAVREDEVAAASMGVPLVKTKLLAYAAGAAVGGIGGAFLGMYDGTVNADQFEFSFSIFILAMVILGGLGSVWGVVIGAVALAFINERLIPDVLNPIARDALNFDLTQLSFGIFGFLLVLMMVLRPEGLLPERRRRRELKEGIGADASGFEARP